MNKHCSYTPNNFLRIYIKNHLNHTLNYRIIGKVVANIDYIWFVIHWNVTHKSSEIERLDDVELVYVDTCTIYDIHFGS